ncbi:segregation/condensation protein A [Candidatus Cyanaurora vandensis]|uniref:segregation/condensation protein A n=1 Tax=Candidatus Cyanaurora vandensis TaxID=2714958 RepID=UPI00257A4093|nr:ScpA family protein [Candidatus Cyanaurora vandensis]
MAQDALGLILALAQRGEVDPWDVDVVQLTDRFLASLGELINQDLALTGQALFYAALLIHLKAEALELRTFPPDPIEEAILEEPANIIPFPMPLEQIIKRRLAAPQTLPQRPLTLADLLAHLKEAESLEEQIPILSTRRIAPSPRSLEQVKQLAHQENLEDLIQSVRLTLTPHFKQAEGVSFTVLAQESGDQLGTFIALLFLCARALVTLEQPDFYGEVWVTPGPQWGME